MVVRVRFSNVSLRGLTENKKNAFSKPHLMSELKRNPNNSSAATSSAPSRWPSPTAATRSSSRRTGHSGDSKFPPKLFHSYPLPGNWCPFLQGVTTASAARAWTRRSLWSARRARWPDTWSRERSETQILIKYFKILLCFQENTICRLADFVYYCRLLLIQQRPLPAPVCKL